MPTEDRLLIFWNNRPKEIPPRPRHPEQFPEHDARHWYDMEYAGWGARKEQVLESPCDGPYGKKVAYLQPGLQPYHVAYAEGLGRVAQKSGVRLLTFAGDMTVKGQDAQVHRALLEKSDLAILVPISSEACTRWVGEFQARRIPVIVGNFIPAKEAYQAILSWCGPDDWGQFRMLAHTFADLMGHEGSYAILRHWPGTSCFEARTWSVITELKKIAPRMNCVAMAPASHDGVFDPEIARRLVMSWIRHFEGGLKGLVLPDESIVDGVIDALHACGREDIICVGAGQQKAMRLIKEGMLHAIIFQSPQADGALSMKIAADWFNGLVIEPVNYLPRSIIIQENVDDFLSKKPEFFDVSLELLTRSVLQGNEAQLNKFFEDAYQSFLSSELMTAEIFRGFSIEVVSTLIYVMKLNDVDERSVLSDFENLYKNLFNQKTPKDAMSWMKRQSRNVIYALIQQRQQDNNVDRILRYLNKNYTESLSLKTLACQFGISAPYLGRLIRKQVGMPFSTYLNELRLRKADELLRFTNLKASQIAKRIGYANVNYFYTLFKKFRGTFPSESKSGSCQGS